MKCIMMYSDSSMNNAAHFAFTAYQFAFICLGSDVQLRFATTDHPFPSSKIDTMTLPKHALAYENCTLDELRTFVQDRGLHKTEHSQITQEECIRLLRNADKSMTFRFTALAGEIRNRIYDELLTLNDVGKCHPQILRASKSIHGDASEMIYSINTPTARFVANHLLFLETRRAPHDYRYEPIMKLNAPPWPLSFLKFEKVRILLDEEALYDAVDQGHRRSAWEDVSRSTAELYTLVSFLQKSTSLKSVLVEGKAYETVNHLGREPSTISLMMQCSFAISRLCANFNVDFKGMDHWPGFQAKVREDALAHADLLTHDLHLGMQCISTERIYCHSLLGTLGKMVPLEVLEEFRRLSHTMCWRYDAVCWFDADMEQHMKDIIIKLTPILDRVYGLAASRLECRRRWDRKTEEYVEAHAIRLSLDIRYG
ncbi:uncharacterized protein MYCFIDRAFT_211797 [Pseudocercospora fijiensis CIRAD86]|uniref:Uncharacterized protein n=1 Tax=Pseudocercospora fijiensis (strain CIRAD86) TaxID=383855 RepID=M2YU77_PSEFD|nr:uncharacterized protein MYCFIDRAFT_211797 [Pseudocercospora fijiensis CIRAD86]EME81265.1 hypothetical protein MYCFIDRAFT_211797 [Pseudocercospora fijiensis CIRAD86]